MNTQTCKEFIAAKRVTGGRIVERGPGFQIEGGEAARAYSAGYLDMVRHLIADGKTYRNFSETLASVTDAQVQAQMRRYAAMWEEPK